MAAFLQLPGPLSFFLLVFFTFFENLMYNNCSDQTVVGEKADSLFYPTDEVPGGALGLHAGSPYSLPSTLHLVGTQHDS